MLGLGSIKDRIATIGEGIKSQFVTETETEETNTSPNAGNKILTYYQVTVDNIVLKSIYFYCELSTVNIVECLETSTRQRGGSC